MEFLTLLCLSHCYHWQLLSVFSSCVFDDWPSIAMSTLLAIICSSCACIQAAIYRFLVKWLAFMITTGSMLLYFQLVWNTFLIPSFSSRSLLLSLLKRRPSEHEIFSPRRMRQKSMTNFPPAGIQEAIRQFDWLFAIPRSNSARSEPRAALRWVNGFGMSKFDVKPHSLPIATIICNLFPKFEE